MKANGWPVKTLGELCTLRPPKAEIRKRLGIDSLVSFLPMEDLGIDEKYPAPVKTKKLEEVQGSYTYFADGDVLLAKVTPCFQNGKLGIAKALSNGVGFGSSEFFVLRPYAELDSEYLYYFLSRADFREQGVGRMGGAVGLQRVPPEFVLSEPLPVPPLAEQRRIVGILDEAFAAIATAKANAEKNLQNARDLFESRARAFFEESSAHSTQMSLEDVCSIFVDSAHRTPKYQAEGIPALRPRDVVDGKLSLETAARVSEAEYEIQSKRHKPRCGDIVYSRELSLGWAALLPESPRVCLSQGMCLFRPSGLVDPVFLLHVLNGPIGRKQALKAAVGAAHPHINLGDIKRYQIPVPPRDAQDTFVMEMDALEAEIKRLESLYQQKLAALDALKKSLLHHAFTGQLSGDRQTVAGAAI